ncbi:uncharacterized protein [Haliotis asinina]|uniref:uncharacterized protein n=1 Tax=Haliotis asinina TaxID=109174 RepID=UPI00353253B7
MADDGIWIFLDDSNLWIEAKKVKGRSLNKEFTEDPRLRIDVGRLANLISNGRVVNKAILYGSEPPPIDTVWKKIKEKGWEIKKHKRSRWTGKEKKVDTQIVADVTELVCDSKNKEFGSTVVIVSGDNDMSPCIEKAIEKKWNVEVWAMEQNLGADLKRLQNKHPKLMTVQYLTQQEHFRKFTFVSERFTISPQYRNELLFRGIVLLQCVRELQDDRNKEFIELKQILDEFKWPWKHAWLLPKSSEAAMSEDLVILFLQCQNKSLEEDAPLELYTPELKRLCQPKLCKNVLTYFEYTKQQRQDTALDLCSANLFDLLRECKDDDEVTMPSATIGSGFAQICGPTDAESNPARKSPDATSSSLSKYKKHDETQKMTPNECQDPLLTKNTNHQSGQNEDPFQQVQYKKPKKYKLYTTSCEYHFQCVQGKKCKHDHSVQEISFFEKRDKYVKDKTTNKLYRYKTLMCNNIVVGSICRYQDACMFAHSEEEQVCCQCHLLGHPTNECPSPKF